MTAITVQDMLDHILPQLLDKIEALSAELGYPISREDPPIKYLPINLDMMEELKQLRSEAVTREANISQAQANKAVADYIDRFG